MALDATPMGLTANSYGTVEESNDYFANRRLNGETWVALDTPTKEKALIMAANLLERGFVWRGALRVWNQKLAWPRSGIFDEDGRTENYDVIPQGVKEGQFELAFALTQKDRMAAQEPGLLGNAFSKVKAGEVEVEVDSNQVLPIIPHVVTTLLERYGEPKAGTQGKGMKVVKLYR